MTSSRVLSRCRDRLTRLAGARLDGASFRQETISQLKPAIGFDAWCWASTDPLTGLTTAGQAAGSPLAGAQRQLFELEFSPGDINVYHDLARVSRTGRLFAATDGNPGRSRRWAELLGPRGVGDELRAALTSGGNCWGHLVLYRCAGARAFTAADAAVLAPMLRPWAARHRREVHEALAPGRAAGDTGTAPGQAIMLLDAHGKPAAHSDQAAGLFASLPHRPDPASPPLAVTALAAWLTVRPERAASPPVPICDTTGRWQVVQAHRLNGAVPPGTIAITLAPATPAQLAPLTMAATGLTPREREITTLVLTGQPTTQIAAALHITPYTVQDHLRGVFRKLAVADRHQLTARLLHPPTG